MGQMQRRQRQFRESMRRDGEAVPNIELARRRSLSLHARRSILALEAGMEVVRARKAILALKPSDGVDYKVEVARITLAAWEANIARIKKAAAITAP